MIGLDVLGIRLISPDEPPVLLLQEQGGTRCLPIWIGHMEAAAIAGALEGEVPQRPMTHDLLAEVIAMLSEEPGTATITEMAEGVYDAVIEVGERTVAARPSDCVAVAVRLGWPIQCPPGLMDQVGVEVDATETDEVEAFRAFLDTVNADDFEDE